MAEPARFRQHHHYQAPQGNMKHWTIGKRVVFGFVVVILIGILVSVFAYLRLSNIRAKSHDLATDSFPGQSAMNQIEFNAQREVLLTLQHIPSEDPKEMTTLDAQIQTNQAQRIQLFKDYEA